MKANELMLGNYVQNTNGNIGKVIGYTEYGEVIVRYSSNSTCFSDPSLLLPIPLTSEILEKNGYDNNEGEENFYHKSNDVSICLGYGKWWGIYIRKGCRFEKSIRYVHELQNALCICGKDKEIVL